MQHSQFIEEKIKLIHEEIKRIAPLLGVMDEREEITKIPSLDKIIITTLTEAEENERKRLFSSDVQYRDSFAEFIINEERTRIREEIEKNTEISDMIHKSAILKIVAKEEN